MLAAENVCNNDSYLDWSFDQAMKDHPESKSVDYDIVVNSKAYFVYNATQTSKFRYSVNYFTWIDAGYGRKILKTLFLFRSIKI